MCTEICVIFFCRSIYIFLGTQIMFSGESWLIPLIYSCICTLLIEFILLLLMLLLSSLLLLLLRGMFYFYRKTCQKLIRIYNPIHWFFIWKQCLIHESFAVILDFDKVIQTEISQDIATVFSLNIQRVSYLLHFVSSIKLPLAMITCKLHTNNVPCRESLLSQYPKSGLIPKISFLFISHESWLTENYSE